MFNEGDHILRELRVISRNWVSVIPLTHVSLGKLKSPLYGHKVTIRTDHSTLKWLMNFPDPKGNLLGGFR